MRKEYNMNKWAVLIIVIISLALFSTVVLAENAVYDQALTPTAPMPEPTAPPPVCQVDPTVPCFTPPAPYQTPEGYPAPVETPEPESYLGGYPSPEDTPEPKSYPGSGSNQQGEQSLATSLWAWILDLFTE